MQKYRCYYLNDFNDDYSASSEPDADGDWYRVKDADACIAELEQFKAWAEPQCQDYAKQRIRIIQLEGALLAIAGYDPGHFRSLEDEIAIWRIATEAMKSPALMVSEHK